VDATLRARIAIGIASVAIALGVGTLAAGQFDSGILLTTDSQDRVVVSEVSQTSQAWVEGLRPGMVVIRLAGATLIALPQYVYSTVEPSPDPVTGELPASTPIGVEPSKPTTVPMDPAVRANLMAQPVTELAAIQPWDLEQGTVDNFPITGISDNTVSGIRDKLPAVIFGIALLMVLGWWLASGRAGGNLRPLAAPLAVATAVPFIAQPFWATWSPPLIATGGVLTILAMVPLALGLIDRIDDRAERRLVEYVTAACMTGAVTLAIAIASFTSFEPWSGQGIAHWALVGAIPIIPGLAAAGPIQPGGLRGAASSSGRLLESTEFAVAGVTPLMALLTDTSPYIFPLWLWFALVLTAGRFTIRPLARLATRAALQRDLVVAATEAERARVAADIHDDALQELTLLVQRLDAAGDTEGAEIARTVSDRLRAICGDLRLPILDDLGVGPALDWLVLRIERLAGGEVRLERSDGTRPPADVELAFFRVAQEALSNAVKHGRPPIVVRYATSTGGASLSIDDAGPGIEPGAGDEVERSGHFGLLNMEQRAEAIGAILDVRRWPSGGTHVALDWRAR
jgi:signal transduction histidine kinase